MSKPAETNCCRHELARFKRLGVLHDEGHGEKHFLMVCQACGSTVSTRTLRARREMRKTILLSLSLI